MDDIYSRIADAILRQIDSNPGPWECPWHRNKGGLPRNGLTGRSYRGINTISLWCGGQLAGYADDRWATYRQWAELGAQVGKGEHGTLVLFFKDMNPSDDVSGSDSQRRFVARASTVFNAEQVTGLPAPTIVAPTILAPTLAFDAFATATGAVVQEAESACYIPGIDVIRMPTRDRFQSVEGYCATLAHELVHWTGAKTRLDRNLTTRFRTEAYAAEELVAELGSAFVMAHLGLAPEPHIQHAAYMTNWLPLVRSDARALFTAASLASRAAQFLHGLGNNDADLPRRHAQVSNKVDQYKRVPPRTWMRGSRAHLHSW